MINQIVRELLDIVNAVINKQKYDQKIKEPGKLYKIAKENGLSGMIYEALTPSIIDSEYYNKFQRDFYQYTFKDELQNQTIIQINSLFNDENIDHIFLKGAYLKSIYPSSYMRSMGDIDILIKETDINKVNQILINNDFKITAKTENHINYRNQNNLLIEIHPKLSSVFPNNTTFDNVWDNVVLVDKNRYEIKHEYHLVYLLNHAAKHIYSSGIGLRTILDIGLFIKVNEENFDVQLLNELINNANLNIFFKNILVLINEYFKINSLNSFISDFKISDDFISEVTEYFVKAGVHGTGRDFNPSVAGMSRVAIEKEGVKKGKIIYILKTLFPGLSKMRPSYPFLKKFPFLLPAAWIHRLFKLLFNKTKESFLKLKRLKVNDKEIKKTSDLFKKLGL